MGADNGELNRRIRELEALNAVATAVSHSLDLNEVIQEAVDQILAVIPTDVCAVYLRDSGSGDLVLAAIRGVSDAFVQESTIARIPAGVGWWGQLVTTRKPLVLEDTSKMDRPSRDAVLRESLRSTAYVPLLARGEINGAIVIASRRWRRFGADDLGRLAAIGEQIGVAVENARLYDVEQTRVRQLTLINAIGQRIAATLELDNVLEQLVSALHVDFGYQLVAILLVDPAGQELELKAVAGDLNELPRPGEYRQSISKGMMGRCVRTGEVALANDVTQDPDYFQLEGLEVSGSEICVPIKVGDQVCGVLNVESDQLNAFDENDVVAIQTLADQLGIALQNARLFDGQGRQLTKLQTLHEVARTISSSLDLNEALDRILGELKRVVTYDSAAVWLIEGDSLRVVAARKYGDVAPDMEVTLPVVDPLFQEAKQTGRPVVREDAKAEPRFTGIGDTDYVRGWVCAPLVVRDRVIGCLTVDSREVAAYDDEDAGIIMTFARHAAVALENALLYEELEKLATHDGLTGLYNHRHFHELLEDEVVRSERYGHALGLLMIDVDGFKEYNDLYGHPAGDDALRGITEILRRISRETDLIARYGGEEFAIILPETSAWEAARVAGAAASNNRRTHPGGAVPHSIDGERWCGSLPRRCQHRIRVAGSSRRGDVHSQSQRQESSCFLWGQLAERGWLPPHADAGVAKGFEVLNLNIIISC